MSRCTFPSLLLSLFLPSPKIPIPSLPKFPPPFPLNLNLPGLPNLSLSLNIPIPNIHIPSIPKIPNLFCPLDVEA